MCLVKWVISFLGRFNNDAEDKAEERRICLIVCPRVIRCFLVTVPQNDDLEAWKWNGHWYVDLTVALPTVPNCGHGPPCSNDHSRIMIIMKEQMPH